MIVKYDNTWLRVGSSICSAAIDPLNPLGLPPFTMRVRTSDGQPPNKYSTTTSYETATLVAGTNDVYDVVKNSTDWSQLLMWSDNTIEVLGANTTGVINMYSIFRDIPLTSTVLFDTSSVTDISYMYYQTLITELPLYNTANVTDMSIMCLNCSELKHIPLFDTSNVINMSEAFRGCYKVESGALALYQQASTQGISEVGHEDTFYLCGIDTVTGAAELAQIPSSWGGTGA